MILVLTVLMLKSMLMGGFYARKWVSGVRSVQAIYPLLWAWGLDVQLQLNLRFHSVAFTFALSCWIFKVLFAFDENNSMFDESQWILVKSRKDCFNVSQSQWIWLSPKAYTKSSKMAIPFDDSKGARPWWGGVAWGNGGDEVPVPSAGGSICNLSWGSQISPLVCL